MRGLPTEIVEELVVCPHELRVHCGVLMSPRRPGNHQLHVHAFFVHIPEAGFHNPFRVGCWELAAHELLGATPNLRRWSGLSQGTRRVLPPTARGPAEVVAVGEGWLESPSGSGALDGDLVGFEFLPQSGGQVQLQSLRWCGHVRIRVIDLHPISHTLPLC